MTGSSSIVSFPTSWFREETLEEMRAQALGLPKEAAQWLAKELEALRERISGRS